MWPIFAGSVHNFCKSDDDIKKKKILKERKELTPGQDSIFDAVKEQTQKVVKPPEPPRSKEPTVEEVPVLSPEQRVELPAGSHVEERRAVADAQRRRLR